MKTAAFVLACAISLCAVSVHAQPGDRAIRKIAEFKKMKLLEVLDLSEDAANKFLVKYDKWEKDIIDLTQQHANLAQEMKKALDANASDEELNTILDKLVAYKIRIDNTKHDMFIDLRTILTPKQAVKVAVFEVQFQKKLHDSIDKLRDRGDRGRGPRWGE